MALKKEIANYVINLFKKKRLVESNIKKMSIVVENIIDETHMNVVMRLLYEFYYFGNNISANSNNQKIRHDKYVNKLIN